MNDAKSWVPILMGAGASSRFKSLGYPSPKATLPVQYENRPGSIAKPWGPQTILSTAINFVAMMTDEAPIVVMSKELDNYVMASWLNSWVQKRVVIPVLQDGAAMSVVLAGGYLRSSDPVILVDTDNIYYGGAKLMEKIKAVVEVDRTHGLETIGSITSTITGTDLEFFKKVDADGKPLICGYSDYSAIHGASSSKIQVSSTKEGFDFNDSYRVNVGIYFFSRWSLFLLGLAKSIQWTVPGSEISIVRVMQSLSNTRLAKETGIELAFNDWKPCGTPMQYEHNKGDI